MSVIQYTWWANSQSASPSSHNVCVCLYIESRLLGKHSDFSSFLLRNILLQPRSECQCNSWADRDRLNQTCIGWRPLQIRRKILTIFWPINLARWSVDLAHRSLFFSKSVRCDLVGVVRVVIDLMVWGLCFIYNVLLNEKLAHVPFGSFIFLI